MPPRYLKSLYASVALPAWFLGHYPWERVVVVCYSDFLARQHANDFRLLVSHPIYQGVFSAASEAIRALAGRLVWNAGRRIFRAPVGGAPPLTHPIESPRIPLSPAMPCRLLDRYRRTPDPGELTYRLSASNGNRPWLGRIDYGARHGWRPWLWFNRIWAGAAKQGSLAPPLSPDFAAMPDRTGHDERSRRRKGESASRPV